MAENAQPTRIVPVAIAATTLISPIGLVVFAYLSATGHQPIFALLMGLFFAPTFFAAVRRASQPAAARVSAERQQGHKRVQGSTSRRRLAVPGQGAHMGASAS